jgi:hypothetical protein
VSLSTADVATERKQSLATAADDGVVAADNDFVVAFRLSAPRKER